jgi:hypothetical protein
MYIIDDDNNTKLDSVTLLLNKVEAKQFLGYLKQLLEENPKSDHYHLESDDFQQEITICLYEHDKLDNFSDKINKIINDS